MGTLTISPLSPKIRRIAGGFAPGVAIRLIFGDRATCRREIVSVAVGRARLLPPKYRTYLPTYLTDCLQAELQTLLS